MQNCIPMPPSTLLKQTATGSSSFSTLAGSARSIPLFNEEFTSGFSGDGDGSVVNVWLLASVWPGHLHPIGCSQNLEKTFPRNSVLLLLALQPFLEAKLQQFHQSVMI